MQIIFNKITIPKYVKYTYISNPEFEDVFLIVPEEKTHLGCGQLPDLLSLVNYYRQYMILIHLIKLSSLLRQWR